MIEAKAIILGLGSWVAAAASILLFDQFRSPPPPPEPVREAVVKEEAPAKEPTVLRLDGDGVPVYIWAYTPFSGVWCFSVKTGTSCITGYPGTPREAIYQEP